MRTKTLLLTAALGVVGAANTMAQVYSVNAVGYVTVDVKVGWQIIANPLDAGTGNNTVGKLLASAPDQTVIYKFTNGAYEPANTFFAPDWDDPAQVLPPGEGFWLKAKTAAKITFVGDVPQGTAWANNQVPAGWSLKSSIVPQKGTLTADLKFPAGDLDVVYQYANGAYLPANTFFAGDGWDGGDPTIGVAEGFWVKTKTAKTWTRNFNVNAP